MWRPTTEAEILAALDGFAETDILEAKELVGRGLDVAKDVAAMATYGGTIIYGIAEHDGRFSSSPFSLDGQELRITQAVDHHLHDRPPYVLWPVPAGADGEEAVGYLVVCVEASPRAPHLVEGRGWARSGPGNVRLDQGAIDMLYERRRSWQADAGEVVARHFVNARTREVDVGVVVQPLYEDRTLRRRVWPKAREIDDFRAAIQRVVRAVPLPTAHLVGFGSGRARRGVDDLALTMSVTPVSTFSQLLSVRRGGGITLFWSGLSNDQWDGERRVGLMIAEEVVAHLIVHTFALAGDVLSAGGTPGRWRRVFVSPVRMVRHPHN